MHMAGGDVTDQQLDDLKKARDDQNNFDDDDDSDIKENIKGIDELESDTPKEDDTESAGEEYSEAYLNQLLSYYKDDPTQLSEYQVNLIKDKIQNLEKEPEQPKPAQKFRDIEDLSDDRSESPIEVDPIEERTAMPVVSHKNRVSPAKPKKSEKVTHPVNNEIDYTEELESIDDPRDTDRMRKSADLEFENVKQPPKDPYARPHAPSQE